MVQSIPKLRHRTFRQSPHSFCTIGSPKTSKFLLSCHCKFKICPGDCAPELKQQSYARAKNFLFSGGEKSCNRGNLAEMVSCDRLFGDRYRGLGSEHFIAYTTPFQDQQSVFNIAYEVYPDGICLKFWQRTLTRSAAGD